MDPTLMIAGGIVLVVVVAVIAYLAGARRREELTKLSASLGWRFDPKKDRHHDDRHAQFGIFRRGFGRVAFNTLSGSIQVGERELAASAGDFSYQQHTGSGENQSTTTYTFSYLIIALPWPTPKLMVRPEGFFDKVAAAFGFDDIDFESAEFSRRFCVKSADKRFAYDVLHPRAIELLLATKPPMIELEAAECCISDGQRRWRPEDFRRQIQFASRFLELWPRHLTRDLESA